MQFSFFAEKLKLLEETPSRLAMTEQLTELFAQLEPDETAQACYLLQGRLVPQYESLEFNLSVKMVLRALGRVATSTESEVTNLFGETVGDDELSKVSQVYKQLGDIGLTAQSVIEAKKQAKSSSLSLRETFDRLTAIAHESGSGSQERKLELLVALISASDALSARYIARIVIGKLRLGFGTMTMIDALSWVVTGDKQWSAKLENAWEKKADLGRLATVWLTEHRSSKPGFAALLETYSVEVGVPVMPALCQRLNTAQEIVDKLHEVIAEPKYDGLRLQIHFWHDAAGAPQIRAYSRTLEDMTHMFPELESLPRLVEAKSCILDCEAIGYDPQTGKLKVFQETITRKRKHDVAAQSESVPIRFYLFDLLEHNGTSLIKQPLLERKQALWQLFNVTDAPEIGAAKESFFLTPYIMTSDPVKLHAFHESTLAEGLEGAVIKQAESPYRSGRKGWRWVKIKESEGNQGKLADTLDVIMMGYYKGRGKRTQFGLGAILTGVVSDDGSVVTIGKIGTGMSEDQLQELKTLGDQYQSAAKPAVYGVVDKSLVPDIWLEPAVVIEVAADEITDSPVHSAGVALRFPRLIRIRDDKTWEQATTTAELNQIRKGTN